jgi:hypothetical protein
LESIKLLLEIEKVKGIVEIPLERYFNVKVYGIEISCTTLKNDMNTFK